MVCAHGKKLSQETWAVDDRGHAYMHWVHHDDGQPCIPDEQKTFAHCDRLRAGIRAFRQLESTSLRVQ